MSDKINVEYKNRKRKNMISEKDFWYILAESHELKKDQLKARELFNDWLVLFRDQNGMPAY